MQLNQLVGLSKVKSKVNELIAFQKVQQLRRNVGLHSPKGTMHLAFIGNPGTGKTSVARIVGRVYKKIGLLSKGHFIEVSRTNLIAGYQGQTALKVKGVIEKAKGGVLFIDEAYSLTENDHADSYGRECLTELTKALEDYRDDLVVIVAGYRKPMEQFFDANPGLRSRFNTFIEFDDYSKEELIEILKKICKDEEYYLSHQLEQTLSIVFSEITENKDANFSNGRYVRNVFERATLTAENTYVTPGSAVKVIAKGVSPAGTAAEIPSDAVWQMKDSSMGTVNNGVFTSSGKAGAAVVQA
jgi:SpoVK/Ycf46/Vps4 family AAA+-type ATPase